MARRPTSAPRAGQITGRLRRYACALVVVRGRVLITVVVVFVLAAVTVAVARTLKSPLAVKEAPVRTAAPAAPARRSPIEAGAPAALSLHTTFGASTHGELSSLELDLARGFHFDPRAAATCTDAEARAAQCPPTSTIGGGKGEIVVYGTYLPRTPYRVSVTFSLAGPRDRSDVAGIVLDLYEPESRLHAVMLGRVTPLRRGPYGLAMRFADTDRELPAGYQLTLLELSMLLQARRSSGRATYNLLTNPVSCSARGWPVQLSIVSSGQHWIYRSTASCKPRG